MSNTILTIATCATAGLLIGYVLLIYELFTRSRSRVMGWLTLVVFVCLCANCAAFIVVQAGYPRLSVQQTPKDGSLIFWKGGPLGNIIQRRTGSDLSHAAIVLNGYVYEAVPPVVHKVKWSEYVKDMARHKRQWRKFDWFVIEPKRNYNLIALYRMHEYAEAQLGRPYMLRGWWQGRETTGLFCSQYVANTLSKSGVITSNGYDESPGSLYKKVQPLYDKR